MEYTIHSKRLNRIITFYNKNTFIYVNMMGFPNQTGCAGVQICKGGNVRTAYRAGEILTANKLNFKKVCNSWLKQFYKKYNFLFNEVTEK